MLVLDDEIINANRTTIFPKRGFIVSAAMHVTGKGIQGRLATQCLIGTGVAHNRFGEPYPWLITAAYKKLSGKSAEDITRMVLQRLAEGLS